MRIAYNDIISKLDSSKLTCATVNPNYPISNVQDQRLGFCSMMASTSSIIIDFTDHGYKINTIALLGHHMPRVICSGSGMSVVSDCCDLNIGVRD